MQFLRANTAVDVLIGPFVDDADGDTPITGSTLDVELSKNGQALANKNDATAPVHDAAGTVDGYYNCELDSTDTNTEGTLTLVVHHADSLPVRHDYMVMAEAAYDSMFVAKDDGFMDVNVKTVGRADTQETEADNLESACANYSVTRGLTGTALPAAAAAAAGGIPLSTAGGLEMDTLADWVNGGRLDLLLDAIPTTAMRGTDNAALASVVGTLADAAAAGEVTEADTLMQYIKQLINILIGATGIAAFPAEAAPGDAVSLAEVIRAIHADVTGLNGDAMRGTDGANTTVPDAAGTLASYDPPTKAEMDAAHAVTDGLVTTVDTVVDGIQTDLSNGTDGLGALKTLIDALNDISAADVKTAMEADAGDLSSLMEALVNKRIWKEADGELEMFDDSDVSQGKIAAQVSTDGTYTTAKRAFK